MNKKPGIGFDSFNLRESVWFKVSAFMLAFFVLFSPLRPVFAQEASTADSGSKAVLSPDVAKVDTTEPAQASSDSKTDPTTEKPTPKDDSTDPAITPSPVDPDSESIKPIEDKTKPTDDKDSVKDPVKDQQRMSAIQAPADVVPQIGNTDSKNVIPEPDPSTGALVYEYPITVPAGRNSLTPKVSLKYNSQDTRNDSAFGYGWSVSIPYIERLNKHGTNELFNGTYNDFSSSLDGELTKVTSTTYASKSDDGELHVYSLSSDVFSFTDKLGNLYKFGETAASRQDDSSNTTHIAKWMLSSITDSNGNSITYSYYKNQNQIYPDTISYGVLYAVQFLRTSRTDVITSYSNNFSVTTSYKINEIDINTSGSWTKKHVISYTVGDNGVRSMLASVTQSGKDSLGNVTSLPPIIMTYTHATPWWTSSGYSSSGDPNYSGSFDPASLPLYSASDAIYLDQNGDGYTDIIYGDGTTNGALINNAMPLTLMINPPYYPGKIIYNNPFVSTPAIALPNNSGFTAMENRGYNGTTNPYPQGFLVNDFNGDLLPDVQQNITAGHFMQGNGTYTDFTAAVGSYINQTSSWSTNNAGWNLAAPVEDRPTHAIPGITCFHGYLIDLNSDGLADFVNDDSCNSIVKAQLNTGSNFATNQTIPLPAIPTNFSSYPDSNEFIDINGDGLLDYLHLSQTPTSNNAYLNKGDLTWTVNSALKSPMKQPGSLFDLARKFIYVDINADGLTDIVPDNVTPQNQLSSDNAFNFFTYLNTGNGWVVSYPWDIPRGGLINNIVVELNGDGLPDFMGPWDFALSRGTYSDLLSVVTLPTGGTIEATYKASTSYRDSNNNLLNSNLPLNVITVNTIKTTDTTTGVNGTSSYEYSGGYYYFNNAFDKKFAGFEKVTQTKPDSSKVVTYYHQGNTSNSGNYEFADHVSKLGRVYRVDNLDASGNKYSRTTTKYDQTALSSQDNNRYFVYPIQVVSELYDGNTSHKDTAVTYSWNSTTGNLNSTVEYGEVTTTDPLTFTDTASDKKTTNYSYATNGSGQYKVSQETVLNQNSSTVNDTKHYYDTLALGSLTIGNQTKIEFLKTGTTYINNQKSYNTSGLITSITDARGNVTNYTYDTANLYPVTVTNALSQTEQYLYDYASGQVKQYTDKNGFVYTATYDGLDRTLTDNIPDLTTPFGAVTKTSYTYTDSSGSVSVKKSDYLDATNIVDTYQYFDSLGRLIQERREAETANTFNVRDIKYNNLGLTDKESLKYSSTGYSKTTATTDNSLYTSYTYDPAGRVLTSVNALGTTSYSYDDWKNSITDPMGKIKSYYKDAYSNLIKVEENNAGSTYTTTYTWDLNQKLTNITDALGNVRNFTYDNLGRRLTAEDLHAAGDATFGTWSYSYDNAGNLTQSINPNAQTTNYTYDVLNRQLTEDYTGAAGTEITNTYDTCTKGVGKLCTVTMLSGANTTYTYNARGAVLDEVKTINALAFTTTNSNYDRQGNLLNLIYPDLSEVKYTFNNAGLLEKVERKEGGGSLTNVVSNFDYNPMDQVLTQADSNGVNTINTYDATKLYRLTTKKSSVGVCVTSTNTNPIIALSGSTLVNKTVGDTWTDPGYTATDTEDGNLTSSVTLTGTVNTAVAGTYQIVYSVIDSQGAPAARKIRTVHVKPVVQMNVKALVVAGGGGGGTGWNLAGGMGGGGGGAGGYLYESSHTVTAQSYSITVGAKGVGQNMNIGTNGGDSVFHSMTAKGGSGGGFFTTPLANQGSGGGGGGWQYGVANGGTATSGQGNNGGNAPAAANSGGGGGGGAGSVGGNGSGSTGGNGGNGTANSISGTSVTYAGGGGGGGSTGGTGGAGGGANGSSGVANNATGYGSGGGGGGSSAANTGGSGSDGIVIISYKTDGSDGVSSTSTGGTKTTSGAYTIHTFTVSGTFTAVASTSSNTNPTITLTGSDFVSLNVGDTWTDPGYSATDTQDGNLTSSVTLTGSVNTSTPGTYQIVYSVADSQGLPAARQIRTVVVAIPGNCLQNLAYTYDANNNITKIVDASSGASSKTVDYTYDDLNRLTSATATNVAGGQQTYTYSYAYNAIGNILTRTESVGGGAAITSTYSYEGNTGVRKENPHAVTKITPSSGSVVNYTYDNNGNMLTETSGLSNTWDYNNRLTQTVKAGVTSTYTYDQSGQRVKLANGTTTTYYPSRFYNIEGTNKVKHIFAGSQTVATVKGTGVSATSFFIHTDHLTGSNVVTNTSGTQEELMDYFPFGTLRMDQKAGSFSEQRKYIGQEYDADTGLNYLNARYYQSVSGRFLSQDPVFLSIGEASVIKQLAGQEQTLILSDPQNLNSYAYGRNNPLRYSDPSGLYSWDQFKKDVVKSDKYNPIHLFYKESVNQLSDAITAGNIKEVGLAIVNIGVTTIIVESSALDLGMSLGGAYLWTRGIGVNWFNLSDLNRLTVRPSASDKLNNLSLKLGMSREEILENASQSTMRYVDTREGNVGNINSWFKEPSGSGYVRVTTNPEGTAIISAGQNSTENVQNGINNGSFIPLTK